MSRHQNQEVHLSPDQTRADERCLAASFIAMAGALKSRPQPRHAWDSIACGRAPYKGRDAVVAAQHAMRDAIATGNLTVIEETAERVGSHFDRMKDVALRAYHAITSGRITLAAARTKASKETSEALYAMVLDCGHADREQVVKEVTEAIEALCEYRAQLVAPTQPVNRPRPQLVRV